MSIDAVKGAVQQENSRNTVKELADYVQNMLDFRIDDMDEEAKSRLEKRIYAKLEAGKRLTEKELRFLKRYNPQLYATAKRVEAKRESVEERLEHAHSKEEVEEILTEALCSVSEKDPARQMLTAAVQDTVEEFKKTKAYQRLPQTEQQGKKKPIKPSVTYEYQSGAYQIAYLNE